MGFISEIKKKSQSEITPKLEISKADQEKLKRGEVALITDVESGIPYLVRIDREKVGNGSISRTDLIIEKVKIPNAAKERATEI